MVTESIYTIEVDGISRKYINIPKFEQKLKNNSPTYFSCKVEYDTENLIDFWDLVEIKKNGVAVWKGYVETIDISWDEDGIYYNLSGRDTNVILWKKFNENFTNMHEGTNGFFGSVNAAELIQFLLRCPKSDPVSTYPNNKSGWGVDTSKFTSVIATNANILKQQIGDPNWTIIRKRGMGWKNCGVPKNTDLGVTSIVSNNWLTVGDSPYLDSPDDTNSWINSENVIGREAVFQLGDLSTDATTIKIVSGTVVFRPQPTWMFWVSSECSMYISTDAGSNWTLLGIFGVHNPVWFGANPWRTFSFIFDASELTPADFRNGNLRIKFINNSDGTGTEITHAYISVVYEESGEQSVGDRVDINLRAAENIMGIYIESRADNNSYPRNYEISAVEQEDQDIYDGTWHEADPNSHIGTAPPRHIDFDAYKNEDAYFYKDFGLGYFGSTFRHILQCTVNTDPVPEDGMMLGFWCVTSFLDDLYGLQTTGKEHLALFVWKDPTDVVNGGNPCFMLRELYSGGTYEVYSDELVEGIIYTFLVERSGINLTVQIYEGPAESGILFDTLNLTLHSSGTTFRYLMSGLTANTGAAVHTDVDIEILSVETSEVLVSVTGNTYRDIIHSWSPQSMQTISIRLTDVVADASWGITQIYLYAADELDYRVWYEEGTLPSFNINQYIQAISLDSAYTPALGPINIPEGRLLDTLYSLIQKLNDDYIPFNMWLAMDSTNTFHMKSVRGTDKSSTINFQLGFNLEGNSYSKSVENTVQRIKVSGSGEGKSNDECSSNWVTSIPAEVHSFYEDVVSKKDISKNIVAAMVAEILLLDQKVPVEQIRFIVSKDDYSPLAYEVGDIVTITDTLLGLAVATRIYNIGIMVDADKGEQIIITCGAPYEDVETTWKEIYERLKTIERVGVLKADWSEEGVDSSAIDPTALATMFEATGNNDEEDAGDKKDPQWYYQWSGYAGGRGTEVYTDAGEYSIPPPHSMTFDIKGSNGVIKGPNVDGDAHFLMAERRYDDTDDGNDEFHDVAIAESPKFVVEMKMFEKIGESPTSWVDGDTLDFGFKNWGDDPDNPLVGTGYWFRIICRGEGVFDVYACWTENADNPKYIITIAQNLRYRYEIVADPDRKWVTFDVYDITTDRTLPYSAVKMNANIGETVRPFHICLVANHNNMADKQAIAYLYRLKIEYKRSGTGAYA